MYAHPHARSRLIDPKFPHNVLRACVVFGGSRLVWTGDRVARPDRWTGSARLPREERMKAYKKVELGLADHDPALLIWTLAGRGYTPVAVEVRDESDLLDTFVHPERAVYVFGPEDGTFGRGTLSSCHRFVRIPTAVRTPPQPRRRRQHRARPPVKARSQAQIAETPLDEIDLASPR